MALQTVLVAVGPNDDDRAELLANTAVDISGPSGATVILAHVFTDEEYQDALKRLNVDTGSEVGPNDVARRKATIRTIASALESADVDCEIRGKIGRHGSSVVDLADSSEADLLIIGGGKRSPAGKAVFGSIAQDVLLSSPCPVTLVRDD